MARLITRIEPVELPTTISKTAARFASGELRSPILIADGNNLYLRIAPSTVKDAPPSTSWVLRYMVDGKPRTMGLGRYPKPVTLKKAREKAEAAHDQLDDGLDPIEAREAERREKRLEAARRVTFKQAAKSYIAAHKTAWKNKKHADQWSATLETYAYPEIGDVPVDAVDVGMVLKIVQPIWSTVNETANRVRGRIEMVLDWARARGLRHGDNPARWKGQGRYPSPRRRCVAA
ncbi:MAG: Arm DNA-binding domain-containing protein [Caulobacteraceae bacterium]